MRPRAASRPCWTAAGSPGSRSIPELGAVAVRPAPGQSLARARRELEADPAVRRVELERYRTLRYLPDDPALTRRDTRAPSNDFYQWNLRQERFGRAWGRTQGKASEARRHRHGNRRRALRPGGANRLLQGLRLRRLRRRRAAGLHRAEARRGRARHARRRAGVRGRQQRRRGRRGRLQVQADHREGLRQPTASTTRWSRSRSQTPPTTAPT